MLSKEQKTQIDSLLNKGLNGAQIARKIEMRQEKFYHEFLCWKRIQFREYRRNLHNGVINAQPVLKCGVQNEV